MNKSQNQLVLEHLSQGKTLTPLQALRLYSCMRLGARIHNLKGQGHAIRTETIRDPKTGKHYACYSLESTRLPGL